MDLAKYPRTFHLPWSPGATSDDKRLATIEQFVGKEVVVTEKMDGECSTIFKGGCHARSIDSGPHPSRAHVKQLAGHVGYLLQDNWRIVGENVYARHSIEYSELPAYFLAFGFHVLNSDGGKGGFVASWDHTEERCVKLGLKTVPVLYRGPWDETKVRACMTGKSACGGEQEGYVVRITDAFSSHLFSTFVGKYVREGHVQTDEHWMTKAVVPNGLRAGR